MDMFDLASQLFGNRANSVAQGSSVTATGSTASADGIAGIVFDGDVTPAEGIGGEDADQTVIDLPTSPDVAEGDEVIVTLVGDGPLKTPIVTANPGSGDRMAASVKEAHDLAASVEGIAQEAKEVAEATGQHFWPDTDGVHVTEVTQEDWQDSTSASYHSGANVLINALGQLFRDGLNNLLAVLPSAIAIYDGNGNDADNILAEFAADHVRIGGTIPEDGAAVATVNFFDSDADKGALVEGYVSNSYSPTSEDTGWGVQSQDTYTTVHTRTSDGEMEQVNGCVGTADVRLGQSTYWEDGPDGYYQTEATATLEATAQGGTDPTRTAQATASLGVKAVTLNDSTERSYVTVNGQDITTQQAIAALTQPSATYTGTNTTATASASGWQLTYYNTVIGMTATASDYFTNSNGIITVLRPCLLEFSGVMCWTDSIAGNRGFGIFPNGTVGSGTELSAFQYFPNTVNTRKSVVFPPRLLPVAAGQRIAIGRYQQQNAVYQNGTNFSWLTIKVIEDRSV